MRGAVPFLVNVCQRTLDILYRFEERQVDLKAHNQAVIRSTAHYDMVALPGEDYYAEQYWHWISSYLQSRHMPTTGSYLDAGCGQGRLSLRLAEWCDPDGKVLGVDLSEIAVRQASKYAAARKIRNANFVAADVCSFLHSCPAASCDAILFLEVSFFFPDFKAAIERMRSVLKPGGLLFASFRPQYFNLLSSLRNGRRWQDAHTVLHNREGRLWGGDNCFTWQTSPEIREFLTAGQWNVLECVGIGCCSGLAAEPHYDIIDPAVLNETERQKLLALELAVGKALPDCGRYMLVVAGND